MLGNPASINELLEQRRSARQAKSERDAYLMKLHQFAAEVLLKADDAQSVRKRALLQVDKWENGALCSRNYITAWRNILKMNSPVELRESMLRTDDEGIALRQNTPFGFLKERLQWQ
ncbi:hypothetical protein FACS189475_02020 [Betaproteobacteria bacterium]|nr:hypothetical protein FACS189475_02020 [Betaproteobacteria bacterium]